MLESFEIPRGRDFSFYLGIEGFHVKLCCLFYLFVLSLSFNSAKPGLKYLNLLKQQFTPPLAVVHHL